MSTGVAAPPVVGETEPQLLEPLEVISLYPPHDGTLGSLLRSRASVAPDRHFIVFEGRAWSYREALGEIARVAAMLHDLGLRHGDRLGVMSFNHPTTVFTFLALADLGAVMVPVNPEYGHEEARYVFAQAEVCGILCEPAVLKIVRAIAGELGGRPWLLSNAAAADHADVPVFADAQRDASRDIELPPANAEDIGVLLYTSGTTGFPKGVMHSQRNIVLTGEATVERIHLQPNDRALCVMPMFHINAIGYSLAGVLAAGATLILEPRFSASRFWRVVKESGATEVNTLAAINAILMRRPRSEFVPGHAVTRIYGAPYDAETFRVFQQEFHIPLLIEGYGMSEVPGVLNNPFRGPQKIGSMGRVGRHPDPRVRLAEVRIVDEAGVPLPDGVTGEIEVRTPTAMKGYFRDPDQTRAAFRDGWFQTGDLAYRDTDGYFWFVSRKKDIIRKRGENISGAELDRIVSQHPSVLEAAAVPVPSEFGEDDILIAVVARPGAALTAEDVAAWCRERLAPIKTPRYVWITDALPHTPTHRVAKYQLRQLPDLRAKAVDLGG